MSLILVNDFTNSKLKELKCDAAGLLMVDKVDVSGLALESSLSALDAKVTACDTANVGGTVAVSGSVACTHASLPLPTGAALDSSVVVGNGHLSTLAGAVTAGVVQVSAGVVASSHSQVYGVSNGTVAIADTTTSKSSSVDADGYRLITVYGSSTNTSDTEVQIEVSHDNSNWFELNDVFINLDYMTGEFGKTLDLAARYVRLSRSNNSGLSESIQAHISLK
tara:strand:+ start:534 stop:1199 length:666 start_codon:yes stop_codon:yes gene_type:complete